MPQMAFKSNFLPEYSRRCLLSRTPGIAHPTPLRLQNKRQFNSARDGSNSKRRSLWAGGEPPQHFGPKARIPDLFERKDEVHLLLASQQLEWHGSPPHLHHDLLKAMASVGRVEACIGYVFKDKMTCVQALKLTSSAVPLYFKGIVYRTVRNNRLALLGDRVLKLALCELWFDTGNSTSDYSRICASLESREVLHAKGKALGLAEELLLAGEGSDPSFKQVAETVEAILGAVYLDSDYSVATVKKVLKATNLDGDKALLELPGSQDWLEKMDILYQGEHAKALKEELESLEREGDEISKQIDIDDTFIAEPSGEEPSFTPEMREAMSKRIIALTVNMNDLRMKLGQAGGPVLEHEVSWDIKRRIQKLYQRTVALQKNIIGADPVWIRAMNKRFIEEAHVQAKSKNNEAGKSQPLIEDTPSDESVHDGTTPILVNQQSLATSLVQDQSAAETRQEPSSLVPEPSPEVELVSKTTKIPLCKNNDPVRVLIDDIKDHRRRVEPTSGTDVSRRWNRREKAIRKKAWKDVLERTIHVQGEDREDRVNALYEAEVLKVVGGAVAAERMRLTTLEEALATEEHASSTRAEERPAKWERQKQPAHAKPTRDAQKPNKSHAGVEEKTKTIQWSPPVPKKVVHRAPPREMVHSQFDNTHAEARDAPKKINSQSQATHTTSKDGPLRAESTPSSEVAMSGLKISKYECRERRWDSHPRM